MKYLFESASTLKPLKTHPHLSVIFLPKSQNGWVDNNRTFKSAEGWLESIRRKLLILGITDVICIANDPEKKNNEAHRFSFYFTNAAQCFQFQAATITNIKGNFSRQVEAPTPEESLLQHKRIVQFLEEHGITHGLHRKDTKTLVVTTPCRQDDLIIAMQVANKVFDTPSDTPPPSRNKASLLLRTNEKV